MTKSVQDAISLQETLENTEATTFDTNEREIALETFMNSTDQANVSAAEVEKKVQLQVGQAVASRMSELEMAGGALDGVRKAISTVSGQVNELVKLGDVTQVQAKLLKIDDVSNRLDLFVAWWIDSLTPFMIIM